MAGLKFTDTSLFSALNRLEKDLPKLRDGLFKRLSAFVVSDAKTNSPVKTGSLRRGFRKKNTKKISLNRLEIFNPINYASFQEFGTKNFRGNFMLKNAIDKSVKIAPRIFEKLAKKLWSKR